MPRQPVRRGTSKQQKPPAPTTAKKRKPLTREVQEVLKQVEANIGHIQRCFAIGSELKVACPKPSPQSEMREQAAQRGIAWGVVGKYRQFANMYRQTELDRLYKEFRTQRFGLSMTHFFTLICVDDRKLRQTMAMDAVRQKLSVSALRKLTKPKDDNSEVILGRRPDVTKLEGEEVLQEAIHFETAKWCRWLDHLLPPLPEQPRKIKPSLKKRLSELRALVQKVEKLSRR